MRFPRRIVVPIGASFLAAILLPSGMASRTPTAASRAQETAGTAAAAVTPAKATTQSSAQATASRTPTDKWTDAARELATKILAHTSSRDTVALSLRNISALGEDDVSQIRRALRAQLRGRGAHLVESKQASIGIQVTLSENVEGYVWAAEIRSLRPPIPTVGAVPAATPVVMINVARPKLEEPQAIAEPLSIRRAPVYEQVDLMLDVVPLENSSTGAAGLAGAAPSVLVLSLDAVSLFEKTASTGAAWALKQSVPLVRVRPWPRDPRGRLTISQDNSFDVYLPGTKCSGTLKPALTLDCHEGDEPWPIGGTGILPVDAVGSPRASGAAYFAPDHNYFDGRIRFADGREVQSLPFYSAAAVPAETIGGAKGAMGAGGGSSWLLAALDGRPRLLEATSEAVINVSGWGSELVGLQSGCANGWQVLASQAGDSNEPDAVQAYAVVNRRAVAVSLPVEFPGPVTELWPLADGSAAIAIEHNLKTSRYEAYRLSISCGQ